MTATIPGRLRFLVSLAFGLVAGLYSHFLASTQVKPRDFTAVWTAARALVRDDAITGSFYPLPSVVAASPFALIPTLPAANGIFMVIAATAFAWALLDNGWSTLLGFFSASMYFAAEVVQWTPLHASAYVLPPLGLFLVVKPHTGLPLFLARPSWWAVGSAIVCTTAAFVIDPVWISHWRGSLAQGNAHLGSSPTGFPYTSPILLPGGALALVAVTRWRRPEARLLVALACAPQSLFMYDTLPLFLVPRTFRETVVLVALSYVVLALVIAGGPDPDHARVALASGQYYTLLLFLPATIMVMRRPNEGPVPVWLEARIAALPGWLRGTSADSGTRSATSHQTTRRTLRSFLRP